MKVAAMSRDELRRTYNYQRFLDFIAGRCIIEMCRETGRTRRYIDYRLLPLRLLVFAEHLDISLDDLYNKLLHQGEAVGTYYTLILGKQIFDYPPQPFDKEIDGKIYNTEERIPESFSSRKRVDPRDMEYYLDEQGNKLWRENYKPKVKEHPTKKSFIRQRT